MPAQTTTASPPAASDDLDDLFNYDVDTDDVFRDYNPAMDAPVRNTSPARPKATDLGIDEEIQVAKKRRPIAKLDENRRGAPATDLSAMLTGVYRLLSQAGIPKLRRITKERLKFKGKGHEVRILLSCAQLTALTMTWKYADVARLLNLYQLWLDDLYPRAKFADGLAMIEKLGHTKRLQTMRREWIKEGKPSETREEEASSSKASSQQTVNQANDNRPEKSSLNAHTAGAASSASRPPTTTSTSKTANEESLFVSDDDRDAHPSDDELDALLAEDALRTTSTTTTTTPAAQEPHKTDQHLPSDDDLDALLAEATLTKTPSAPTATPHPTNKHDEFEDEMEAMAGMDDMW
ncbi:chromosome segregation in meiosis- protein [Xylographa pallens]|nr:chromosome segregation in meiosis- protein [Xylographa pallens]